VKHYLITVSWHLEQSHPAGHPENIRGSSRFSDVLSGVRVIGKQACNRVA